MSAPSPSFSLEALASFEERSALVSLVKNQLAPPSDAVETFARLRRDAHDPSDLDPVVRRALGDQMDWVNRELLGLMAGRIQSMLEWCVRLKLVEPSEDWSPRAWVKASQAMACESTLIESVIAHAPATSWASWRAALRVDENWAAKWQGWARAFEKTPAQALRWLDEFLVKPANQNDQEWTALLGAYRGRLALQIFLGEQRKWPVASLKGLDARLQEVGAPCLLKAIDFSLLLKESDKLVSAATAKQRFRDFLLSHRDEAKAWLEEPQVLAGHGLKVDPQMRASRLWAFLSILGYHQVAGAHDLELAFRGVVHAKFGGPGWEAVIDDALFKDLGAVRPLPPTPVAVKKKAVKKVPAAAAHRVEKAPADVQKTQRPGVAAKPADPVIPRFPKRA